MSKYQKNYLVSFTSPDGSEHSGYIFVIDILSDSVTYDLFCKEEKTVYKHIKEKYINKVIAEGSEDDYQLTMIFFNRILRYIYDDRG